IRGDGLWYQPEIQQSFNHKKFSRGSFDSARWPGETEFTYAERMTLYVNSHTTHYFEKRNTADNIHIIVTPFFYSWPLWLRGLWASFSGVKFTVEFCNPEKGLARGYGFCSQRALTLQNILRENGINARATDLYGHVVCTARINGKDILLDPDYGLASEHSLEDFHKRPELLLHYDNPDVERHYQYLREIYAAARWRGHENREYSCVGDVQLFLWGLVQWGIPLIFIALWIFCPSKHRALPTGRREEAEAHRTRRGCPYPKM
ncbi:MAG: hypothetical protein K2G99_08240, partial [Desulfovibrio sp.]|nr:hypothetical protein [Desulfovibrio sp.]